MTEKQAGVRLEYRIEIGHGRIGKRICYLCTTIDWLAEKDEWTNLNAIGIVICERPDCLDRVFQSL